MKFLKGLGIFLVALGIILGVLQATLLEVWEVPEDDPMLAVAIAPNLGPGDVLVVFRNGEAHGPGDLLRCDDPDAPGRYVIGRMVAKGGDKVDIVEEKVSVGGRRVPSLFACEPAKLKNPGTDEEIDHVCSMEELLGRKFRALRAKERLEPPLKYEVDTGRIFLVSDNRHLHKDSRDFGTIAPETCRFIPLRLWGGGDFGDSTRRFSFLF